MDLTVQVAGQKGKLTRMDGLRMGSRLRGNDGDFFWFPWGMTGFFLGADRRDSDFACIWS
ncbi:hypothetical protein [Massilia glaciei]|uniref:hypothetical protein n=1 Tax=Massilia glaciei TaxID=1524097 RepID=UPI0011B1CB93|nr:hypothetical protein [Massilia glaciei]